MKETYFAHSVSHLFKAPEKCSRSSHQLLTSHQSTPLAKFCIGLQAIRDQFQKLHQQKGNRQVQKVTDTAEVIWVRILYNIHKRRPIYALHSSAHLSELNP